MGKNFLYSLRCLHKDLHDIVHRCKVVRKYRCRFREMQKKNPRTVFLIFTPEHGNMGDHAIAQAEIKLLQRLGVDYIEITSEELGGMKRDGILHLMSGFPIIVHGGGYLGTIWLNSEKLFREILIKNPKSSIIGMPNTVFYGDSENDIQEIENSVRIYNKHKRLFL